MGAVGQAGVVVVGAAVVVVVVMLAVAVVVVAVVVAVVVGERIPPHRGPGEAGGSGIVEILEGALTGQSYASGIWTMNDVYEHELENDWPT